MKKIFLNNDWGFTEKFSNELTTASYNGSLTPVRIPHTCAQTPLHYFDESNYQMVSGYRKELVCDPSWEGKRILLTFDGVGHACTVYLNGRKIGSHKCGYTAFTLELTGKLDFTGTNVLAVEVDSRESLNEPPFGFVIDYMTFGGIYRDVYLSVAGQVFLEDIFIKTKQDGEYRIKSQLRANGEIPSDCHIRQYIRKQDGDYVFLGEIPCAAASTHGENSGNFSDSEAASFVDGDICVINTDFAVPKDEKLGDIKLWDVDAPNLYKLKTQLTVGETVMDEREDTFGFRTAKFEKDGFYLNGKKIKLRGLNRHQSYPYIGYAAPKSLQINDADILKNELGVNIVRTSHYPQSKYFIDRCDEIGLLVFTEIPGWQHIGDDIWKDQAVENTKDMILQYRNHPSIIIWGVRINESVDDDDFYKRTNELAHRLDATRQTGGVRCIKKSHLFEDVYTYNDFVHEGSNRGCEPKKVVTSDVEKPYMITEYNGHMFPTKNYDCEDKRLDHALRHANVLDAVSEQDDIAGCIGWCMFDYNTHKDFGSGDRVCYHGVMDMFRNPKMAAFVYASQQDKLPVLEVSSAMDIGEHPGGVRGQMYLFTNADSVKMYKNDEFVSEYDGSSSSYKHLVHGPVLVDDFIGDALVTNENMRRGKANSVKKILNTVSKVGQNNLPLSVKLTFLKLKLLYRMSLGDITALYNKYIGDWGGEATAYRFDAIKDGKVVKTVRKQVVGAARLCAVADHMELKEGDTYDMAAVRIYMQDEFGNVLSFCNDPVGLNVSGEIELVGPNVISLQGGMGGTYVKTTGKSGAGKLVVTAAGCEPVEIEFGVRG